MTTTDIENLDDALDFERAFDRFRELFTLGRNRRLNEAEATELRHLYRLIKLELNHIQ